MKSVLYRGKKGGRQTTYVARFCEEKKRVLHYPLPFERRNGSCLIIQKTRERWMRRKGRHVTEERGKDAWKEKKKKYLEAFRADGLAGGRGYSEPIEKRGRLLTLR